MPYMFSELLQKPCFASDDQMLLRDDQLLKRGDRLLKGDDQLLLGDVLIMRQTRRYLVYRGAECRLLS